MSLLSLALLSVALSGCGSAGRSVAATATTAQDTSTGGTQTGRTGSDLTPIGAGLDGPAGLKATIYAKGPPTTATFAFDPQGRLWLAAAGLESHTQDGVYLIPEAGAHAQQIISGLNDPLGLDWYQGKLYVASVGRVDAYWNFTAGHFASHQQILSGPVAEGENNLLVTAPNGRLVMGVSATCDHCDPASEWSGSIVSFEPDGRDLRIYAQRIRAPVGLAYFPGSSDLFVSMNQQDNLDPHTPGDWLAIVNEGQNWRFPFCHGQGGPDCAGVPQPVAELDPHAAVGQIAFTTGQLGPSLGTAAIVGEWNRAKVQRIALTRTGNTYHGVVAPFLAGIRNPLALAIAPDRSLLVGDWASGTIYRITHNTL